MRKSLAWLGAATILGAVLLAALGVWRWRSAPVIGEDLSSFAARMPAPDRIVVLDEHSPNAQLLWIGPFPSAISSHRPTFLFDISGRLLKCREEPGDNDQIKEYLSSTYDSAALSLDEALRLVQNDYQPVPRGTTANDIDALADEIRGKNRHEVRRLIVRRFGPPARDIGSGRHIEQWDIAGGTLTLGGGDDNPVYLRAGQVRRLRPITGLLGESLFGSFEMTSLPRQEFHGSTFWVGNVEITPELAYTFRPSSTSQTWMLSPDEARRNFFLNHPEGTFHVDLADGITLSSHLENLKPPTAVAHLTFTAKGGGAQATYALVVDEQERLVFSQSDPMSFQLERLWIWHSQ